MSDITHISIYGIESMHPGVAADMGLSSKRQQTGPRSIY
jgi:hypothetical protein